MFHSLAQDCVGHGQVAATGTCCAGLHPWSFDSKTGLPYAGGFACWYADCVPEGQFSGPSGTDAGKCCAGLVSVAGKCAVQTAGGPGNFTPPPPPPVTDSGGQLIPGVDNLWIYGGLGMLALVFVLGMKGKKR